MKTYQNLFWSLFSLSLSLSSSHEAISSAPIHLGKTEAAKEFEEGYVLFTPPATWKLADPNSLPTHVKAMVVGEGPSSFPPSMNLSSEPYQGKLKDYLKTVKKLNSAKGYEWKDLGQIRTEAGNGSLSQVDTKTQWGDVRLMHAILVKNRHVYILTASALKSEFSLFYRDFFSAMRSLRVATDIYEMIKDPLQRQELKAAVEKLEVEWTDLLHSKEEENPEKNPGEIAELLFHSEVFQKQYWKPFQELVAQRYGSSETDWQPLFLQDMQNRLLHNTSKP